MGKVTGFLEIERRDRGYEAPSKRLRTWREFVHPLADTELTQQAARCMNCGIPFCHTGCPVNNLIPDWNDLVYREQWRAALHTLHSTNNFPEFTGRICPAPCEAACTLNIDDNPVTIKTIECQIVDRGWAEGWIVPEPPAVRSGRSVAVVGSGPAGRACAQQLARAGHVVTVFEKSDRIGGLLRYGIPDFKMEKPLIDRRLEQMAAEGVSFRPGVHVGRDVSVHELRDAFDAVVLSGGAEWPRDLELPPHGLSGIHFAMEFLTQQNRRVAGDPEHLAAPGGTISAAGKHVVVIGGGDTGADCVGNSLREGALSITQLEIVPEPPSHRPDALTPWPNWPSKLRLSYAMKEALESAKGELDFSVVTTHFSGSGRVESMHVSQADSTPPFAPVAGTERELQADLVLLAMGFLHPEPGVAEQLGVALDSRGNLAAPAYATPVDKVFVAGDARRGQSLIVWAINEGRQCARAVDRHLAALPR
jgi:glutamate synthase (NADPH/NADH) small chain